MKLSLSPNLMVFRVSPLLNANVLFCRFFLNLTLCMTKLRVPVLCLCYFTDNSDNLCFSGPKFHYKMLQIFPSFEEKIQISPNKSAHLDFYF